MLAQIKHYRKTLTENQKNWPVTTYPWVRHVVLILPVLAAIVCFHVWIAPQGREFKAQYTAVTAVLKFATTYFLVVFYALYAILMIDAIRKKDYPRQRLVWRYLFFQIIISLLVVHTIKNTAGFPRPGHEDTKPAFFKNTAAPTPDGYRSVLGVLCLPKSSHQSFPSGHTTDILISTLPLALYYWGRWRQAVVVLCGLSAVLVVFSRLWLQSHHAVDTLGGVVLACVGVYFILKKPAGRERSSCPA